MTSPQQLKEFFIAWNDDVLTSLKQCFETKTRTGPALLTVTLKLSTTLTICLEIVQAVCPEYYDMWYDMAGTFNKDLIQCASCHLVDETVCR